jgi:hypothetical protein
LWIAGMLGVLSFLFVDLAALIASIPQPPEGPPVSLPPPALLKLVSIIQPTVIVTLAVALGVWLAERVGLHAPATEAAARGDEFLSKLTPQILPGVLAGLASGVAIILSWVLAKPFLTPEFVTRAQEFNKFLPNVTRLFYGGLTEEVLLRWGVMTLLVWAAWRLLQKGEGTPRSICFILAIVLSAVIFGMGHLPLAAMLSGGLTLPLVIYVVVANSIFGIVAGFLYWLRGLEAAMIAHMSTHLVLILSIYLAF